MCRVGKDLIQSSLFLVCLFAIGIGVHAQSLDARSPSPVRSNEVVGRIAARDLGDSRLTDHFYTFAGTPGDLVITIEARNLNGDIDVFTAGTLRPVLKFAVYAEINSSITKSIYLRQREELILRVEARTPNDDDGIYHLRFSGSFQPVAGAIETTEEASTSGETAISQPSTGKGRRVSSVGARIPEPTPSPEVAAAPTPEPTPAPVESPAELKSETRVETSKVEPTPKSGSNVRGRGTPRRSRNKPATAVETARKSAEEDAAKVEEAAPNPPKAEEPAPSRTGRIPRKSSSKQAEAARAPEIADSDSAITKSPSKPAAESPTEAGEAPPGDKPASKLVIELLDGTRIERFMSAVHQVTVENGQIVITATDGKIERVRLARVIRMSIGP